MLNILYQFSTPLTIAAATVFLFAAQIINGKSKLAVQQSIVSSEVITAYETQVKQLKEKQSEDKKSYDESVVGFRNEITALTLRIGEQNGIMGQQKQVITKYEEILQNRNPELVKILGEIKDFMRAMSEKVDAINDRSEKREKRDKAVDQGHVEAIRKTEI